VKRIFEKAGFSVSINDPYAGGFITAHYGKDLFKRGKMALQIELNQDLYVDPDTETVIPEKADQIRVRVGECLKKIGETA
jgi:N-formylglutamate amidohydrolase